MFNSVINVRFNIHDFRRTNKKDSDRTLTYYRVLVFSVTDFKQPNCYCFT